MGERGEKPIKKDPAQVRETLEEVIEEAGSSTTEPRVKQPNRDRARGDWDRSRGPAK
jgi:hypothetical protein